MDYYEDYYPKPPEDILTAEDLAFRAGCDVTEVYALIDQGFFGSLYKGDCFEEHAVEVLNDYLDYEYED